MNRLFEESFSRGRGDEPSLDSGTWTPLADVYETDEGFVVQVELPGLREADIEVRVEGNALTLKGERRLNAAARPESFHRMERSYGAFSRTFTFPEDVDRSGVKVQCRDGLLRLELPKLRPRMPLHRVRVERS
jgi:HSP20 family protein